jgi:tyrosine-specific transport protein
MKTVAAFFGETGVIVATTIGAGMFALPYVFERSGVAAGVFYLLAVSGVIVAAHLIYWRVLAREDEKERLLALTRRYLGHTEYLVGLVAIVCGLLLALVAYLILGAEFLQLLFPSLGWAPVLVLFWLGNSIPLLFKERRIMHAELLGAALMSAIIVFIFFGGASGGSLFETQFHLSKFFLPFGAVFFALGAWPALEPLYRFYREAKVSPRVPIAAIITGTFISALLYFVFVVGIFGSAALITPDTLAGLTNWSAGKIALLAILGLFAIWTSYLPIGLEIQNALSRDLRWPRRSASLLVIFLPIILVALGVSSFFRVVGFVGGVFVALQYLLIVRVGRKALAPGPMARLALDALSLVVLLAVVYEIYYFVVQ